MQDEYDESVGDSDLDSEHGMSLADCEATHSEQAIIEYEMLAPDELIKLMSTIIQDILSIIQLPKTILRLLLAHFSWDTEALTETYFDRGVDYVFGQANIKRNNFAQLDKNEQDSAASSDAPNLSSACTSLKPLSLSDTSEIRLCDICCISLESNSLIGLGCAHFYCPRCWEAYIKSKVMDNSQIDRILCPAFECDFIVDDSIVLDLIASDQLVRRRFQKLITNSFVSNNRSLIWCPGKACTYAARVLNPVETCQIECTNCGESFCSSCGNLWHDPVPCRQMSTWLTRIAKDSGTTGWIISHTKECPKCKVPIEKAGGCNHMVCYNSHCKYEFCWVCLDHWQTHGSEWYTCNKYDKSKLSEMQESRAEMHRFLFYFDRYMNHAQSLRFEAKLNGSMAQKLKVTQHEGLSYIDLKFLNDVIDVLCRCRRTLMFTYAFAYYVMPSNQSIIFEGNQRDLEQATECLSGLLERDINTTSMVELKQKLQNKSRYCESRRKVLLRHVHEGRDADSWQYQP